MFAIDLNHPDVVAIQKHAKLVRYKKGAIILRSFEETTNLHIVINGLVKAYSTNYRGEESISTIYGPDNIFPLAWIINRQHLPVDWAAMTDCEIALVPQTVFLKFMKNSPDVSYAIMQKILEQFTMFGAHIVNLEYKFARERLAYRLLMLAAKFGKRKGDQVTIPHISQQDLGATINISREVTNKEVARLERRGVITYASDGIVIHDMKRLHQEIGEDTIVPYLNDQVES
ncbi:MAG TPA: Crp/Fnr family transcriptional regulator [Candidatus Saccharimonadales bacterium]|nr:Crp/Fnr family transcriptional regulator [Candidatus Saccharimonadales bacterium]